MNKYFLFAYKSNYGFTNYSNYDYIAIGTIVQ